MIEINRDTFLKLLDEVNSIEDVSRLREMLEGDKYEVFSRLEMSSLLTVLEEKYNF